MKKKEIIGSIKRKAEISFKRWLRHVYHYWLMPTPNDWHWQYHQDRYEEIDYVALHDENGVVIAKFDAIRRTLVISGDNATGRFFVEEGIDLFFIQRQALRWFLHDRDQKIGMKAGFYLLSYHRLIDDVERAKTLPREYSWHYRDNWSWLLKGSEVVCTIDESKNLYRFKDASWRYAPQVDAEKFRNYIESIERSGLEA